MTGQPDHAIDALIFDVGGVIVPHDNAALRRRLAGRCRVDRAEAQIAAALGDRRYETGDLPIAALHERLQQDAGYGLAWDAFVVDWCSHLAIDEAMLAYTERHRVLLFSNTNREHWDHLLRLTDGRLGGFEAYLSHEIGAAKPSPEAYRLVAARAAVDPARALFFDDKESNVTAARREGFLAEVFVGQAALMSLLAPLLPLRPAPRPAK
jgi:FMN phosphatase YigB (HAD superfamily)